MGKVEAIIKSEIVRLARREMKKSFSPLRQDVRLLKGTLYQLKKTVGGLQRFVAEQERAMKGQKPPLEAPPEEVKKARFSPRLIKSLRKHLGVTQREMATLAGVTVGAVYQWEKGMFEPRGEKKKTLVALRKLRRREARKMLEGRSAKAAPKRDRNAGKKGTKRSRRK
jgi:DNA-binding transcriptional regulator YiaG